MTNQSASKHQDCKYTVGSSKKYGENYDNIFNKKKDHKITLSPEEHSKII